MGKTKLVGTWILVLLLTDVDLDELNGQLSITTICLIIAGSLMAVVAILLLVYLKFLSQGKEFKHQRFEN